LSPIADSSCETLSSKLEIRKSKRGKTGLPAATCRCPSGLAHAADASNPRGGPGPPRSHNRGDNSPSSSHRRALRRLLPRLLPRLPQLFLRSLLRPRSQPLPRPLSGPLAGPLPALPPASPPAVPAAAPPAAAPLPVSHPSVPFTFSRSWFIVAATFASDDSRLPSPSADLSLLLLLLWPRLRTLKERSADYRLTQAAGT
jgi:hypothetical protein